MPARAALLQVLSLPLAVLAAAAVLWAAAQPVPLAPLVVPEPQFDAARAQALAGRWSAAYPLRGVGSPAAAAFRAELSAALTDLGWAVDTQPFSVTVASQALAGVNVAARRPGAQSDLWLLANYDTPLTGGRDNLAGVAVLVELARVFADDGPAVTLVFADSGEYGRAWGARAFIQSPLGAPRPLAALEVEALAGQDWTRLRLDSLGYETGAAPVWLRQFVRGAAGLGGAAVSEAVGLEEAAARALPFTMTGASLLNQAGRPAARLQGTSGQPNADLGPLGRTVEFWVRGLAARAALLPAAAPGEWRLTEAWMAPSWAAGLAAGLLFLPLFAAAGLAIWEERPRRDQLWPEAVALAGAGLPVVNAFAVAFSLVRLGLLPGYELFPAAPGDPFLLQPADWAMLVILAGAGLSIWDIWRARGWGRLAGRLAGPARRVTLLLAFSAAALLVWTLNGFAAALLLAPAAWLWPWIRPSRYPAGRALNGLLILGGLLPFLVVVAGLALTPGLGLAWWFLTLGAAYGLYPLPAVLAAAVGAGLSARFLALGLHAPAYHGHKGLA